MAPRKKIHDSDAARMRSVRERFKAEGKRQIAVWLPGETLEKLDRIAATKGLDRGAVLAELVDRAREPKK